MYVSRLLLELKVADSTKTNMPYTYTSRHVAMHGCEVCPPQSEGDPEKTTPQARLR